jgi:hypothetical protein
MFEDDDYAMRVRGASLKVLCAQDVFVHHFGGASFGELVPSGEHARLFEENRGRFERKWGVTWRPHQRRPRASYEKALDDVRAAAAQLPRPSTVVVVSKGDAELLKLEGHRAWHFPQRDDGVYAGHYPADSAQAIAHLESLRARGADYIIFPRTALWWLEHYPQFAQHLQGYQRLSIGGDELAIFRLAATSDQARSSRSDSDGADHGIGNHIAELCDALLPRGSSVLILTRAGDAPIELTQAEARLWQPQGGADAAGLILEIEHHRQQGAEYLVVPARHRSWLQGRAELLQHVQRHFAAVALRERICCIYALRADASCVIEPGGDDGAA